MGMEPAGLKRMENPVWKITSVILAFVWMGFAVKVYAMGSALAAFKLIRGRQMGPVLL